MINDRQIACEIVKKIFGHINLCIQSDRSKIKLNVFEKGIIKGMLSDKILNGINNYIINMNDIDIRNLMDDIQLEINKRTTIKIVNTESMYMSKENLLKIGK